MEQLEINRKTKKDGSGNNRETRERPRGLEEKSREKGNTEPGNPGKRRKPGKRVRGTIKKVEEGSVT